MSASLSLYWQPPFPDMSPELTRAMSSLTGAGVPTAEQQRAFALLLASELPAAQGIAFDQFFLAEAQTRFGTPNPFKAWAEELRRKARAQLSAPPVPGITASGSPITAANHASALGVLMHLGGAEDLETLQAALDTSTDANVLMGAVLAAGSCAERASEVSPRLLKRLAELVLDAALPEDVRSAAVGAVDGVPGPAAEEALVTLASRAPLPFSADAALRLGGRDLRRHRPLLARLGAEWPEDAGYPVTDVRELLEEPEEESP
ncbi:hypothetical protein [Pyxidicoccus caerfyrddinensis]|uniref:hypothetical protein n=1 Tax=Pyxidicoccus caerfyrddinensis TaxID=2709663 RepID=UPI0013D8FAB3|nr:hypothetical protein [Pyxidicoccus caerfyrddinensis]